MNYPDYSDYTIKWASLPWEMEQAHALRRQVFCDEQRLFEHDDRDATDDHARLLVALGNHGGWHQQVVGTVRIHLEKPGIWVGSRLAVDPAFRSQDKLGSTLIQLAVSSAHALGCDRFLATVQHQNERLFQRLNWHTQGECVVRGLRHVTMEADLNHYPPCHTPYTGFVLKARKQHQHTGFWPGLLGTHDQTDAVNSGVINTSSSRNSTFSHASAVI